MIQMKLYDVKEIGKDFIILTDSITDVRITFADTPPDMDFINPTKEEHAAFFKHIESQVGLEAPVLSSPKSRTMHIFLDHRIVDYGQLRSVPFPFPVATIQVVVHSSEGAIDARQ